MSAGPDDDDLVADFEMDTECDFCGEYGMACTCEESDFEATP